MRATHVVGAVAMPLVAIACSLPTGGHHHGQGNGPSCGSTTYISDDFSSASLNGFATLAGTPAISNSVGNPAPSVVLDSAVMQDIPNLANNPCGLTIEADIQRDSGFAFMKVVIPGVGKIAVLQVFDTVSYYVLCNGGGCSHATESHAVDATWHRYRLVIDTTFNGSWLKDGAVMYTVGGMGSYNSLRVNLGALPADSAGVGPSLAYVDNVFSASP